MNEEDTQPTEQPWQDEAHPCPRILLADDERAVRSLMSAVLLQAGYRVDVAPDGAVAWAALQSEPYDLLITDHDMPKLTGLELIRNLRSVCMGLPVIMVTGALPAQELAQNPSLHLSATLAKPFTVPDLLAAVGNALRAAA